MPTRASLSVSAKGITAGRTGTRMNTKGYVANHKAVDSALETAANASNAELKRLLQPQLKIFQGHAKHAARVRA
jgi:putative membrane protein